MKPYAPTLLAILVTTSASPTPEVDPKPAVDLQYEITALNGSACPGLILPGDGFNTRFTYTLVDRGTDYYGHIAYPFFKAGVEVEYTVPHMWCETTLKVTTANDTRLLLHNNGTRMVSTYNLDEGVNAQWKFTYQLPDADEIVDVIDVNGPIATGNHEIPLNATVAENSKPYTFPQCGAVTLKYRTELTVTSNRTDAKGIVNSMTAEYEKTWYNQTYPFGTEQGISFDTEPCTK